MQQTHPPYSEPDHPWPLQAVGRWPGRLGPYELRYDVRRGYDRPPESALARVLEPGASRAGADAEDEVEGSAP